jgi:hypothetical protein
MSGVKPRSVFILMAIFTLCTCIDPYTPKFAESKSLLVVDGQITDENSSYEVKLTKTFQYLDAPPVPVQYANVYITDNSGNNIHLSDEENGIYKTDSSVFRGLVGRNYVLHIVTIDGKEYQSDTCLMHVVPDIESIYFVKDQELANNGTESDDGIRIFLSTRPADSNVSFRWDFVETWKFQVPLPKRYDYISETEIVPVKKIKMTCWKSIKSSRVQIDYINPGQADRVLNEPIYFIASDKSDRLMLQYSILVKQYSVSKSEYKFWKDLKKVNDSGGDIFASQPFSIVSNIHNLNDPKEKVLGYFRVSAVKKKRLNISFSEIVRLNLPFYYNTGCIRFEEAAVSSFDKLYQIYCINSDYAFVEPLYNGDTGKLESLVFARPECADCELTGTSIEPDLTSDLQ